MAREEQAREDLLREATALVERVEMAVEGNDETVVAGFRRDGAASFFFGQQFVYQFNTAGELRRAFRFDRLYKAECGKLVQLTRRRTQDAVELMRHEMSGKEIADFLAEALQQLQTLREALTSGRFHIVGQIPPSEDVTGRVRAWLANLSAAIPVANSPRVQ
ncbi:MAG TPA: hypothetical protein VGJ04_10350 [Pirellulales bacterium]|jgi:hypothetical protein